MLVKGIISPYTPLTAYVAVFLEGLLGYVLFSFIRFEFAAAIIFGFLSLSYSACQKFIVTTLVFGMEFWKSIDFFADYVFSQLKLSPNHNGISASLILISLYTLLHITAGLTAGFQALKIPALITGEHAQILKSGFAAANGDALSIPKNEGKKRPWWKKPTRIALILFLGGTMLLSYFYAPPGKNRAYEIFIMLIRATAILSMWSFLLSSPIKNYLRKTIEKNKFRHAGEIDRITRLFPAFRKVINYCWKNSGTSKGLTRIVKFISESIVLLLICDL